MTRMLFPLGDRCKADIPSITDKSPGYVGSTWNDDGFPIGTSLEGLQSQSCWVCDDRNLMSFPVGVDDQGDILRSDV